MELPSRKIVKEESSESDSKNKDDLEDDSGLNGIKRKRPNPNSDVPEIPLKGIFSSGLFKSHLASSSEHSPLKISPTKRSKKTVSQNFHKKVHLLFSKIRGWDYFRKVTDLPTFKRNKLKLHYFKNFRDRCS